MSRFVLALSLSLLFHFALFGFALYAFVRTKEPVVVRDKPIFLSLADEQKRERPVVAQKQTPKKVEKKSSKRETKQVSKPKKPLLPIDAAPQAFSAPPALNHEAMQSQKTLPQAHSTPKEDNKKSEIQKYLLALKKRLQENLKYPHFAKKAGAEGIVLISFYIGDDGRVTGAVRVIKSSGFSALDEEAIDTVKDSSPFAPPPGGEMEVTIPVSFVLT